MSFMCVVGLGLDTQWWGGGGDGGGGDGGSIVNSDMYCELNILDRILDTGI